VLPRSGSFKRKKRVLMIERKKGKRKGGEGSRLARGEDFPRSPAKGEIKSH